YGTGGTVATARSATTRFSHVLDMTATAYTYGDGGQWGDITATGKAVAVGYVAVDPRVIPLGSRLYITYPNGGVCYGFAVAEDTGGAIKGNRIDLFFESRDDALQFGRRKVKVYVLHE
ncbi:MAG: 3D domain-containing protein, partial [Clostridia bacterium]|nr:3D domain-containing protein [Clostridia bacterium]